MMADWIRVMKIPVLVYAALKAMSQGVYGGLRFYICTVYMYLSCVWSCLLIFHSHKLINGADTRVSEIL